MFRAPTSNTSIFDTFATVAPDVEPTHGTSVRDKCAILARNVGPTSNISILDKFARLAHERGARIGERLYSDFARRVRSESGEVVFPFQSFPDNGESAAGRMPATVHLPSWWICRV